MPFTNAFVKQFFMTKLLDIVVGENQLVLREKAHPITQVTKAIKELAKNMEATMIKAKGLGIAAPQINQNLRIFLAYLNFDTPQQRLEVFINPEITYFSKETNTKEEGCLSLPGRYGLVERSTSITIEYQNLNNEKRQLNLSGMNARVTQHELDHLNGILFIDREKGTKSHPAL